MLWSTVGRQDQDFMVSFLITAIFLAHLHIAFTREVMEDNERFLKVN